MVLNYRSTSEDMYTDFSVVPDNSYKSPKHSPFSYGYDGAQSPASSDISSVDSAFDELAGVIPELQPPPVSPACSSGGESPKYYKDLSNMSPSASSGYFEDENPISESDDPGRQTPSMYDGFCTYPLTPEIYGGCMQDATDISLMEALSKSTEQQMPAQWLENYSRKINTQIDASVDYCQNAEKMRYASSMQMAKHAEALIGGPENVKQPPVYQNDYCCQMKVTNSEQMDVVDDHMEPSNQSQFCAQQQDVPKEKKPSLFIWDEDVLTKGFEILAEYISRDTQPVVVKEECMEEPKFHNMMPKVPKYQTKSYQKNCMSDIDRYKNTIKQLSLAKLKESEKKYRMNEGMNKHMTEEAPMMFSMSNSKSEQSEGKKLPLKSKPSNADAAASIPRNWKIPARQRRSLCLQSTKPRLYNFLLELLQDPESYPCIEWIDESQGIFKFLDSAKIATLWGLRKNKPNMKYENFARSLRTYIAKGILTKPRNKLVYQFTAKVSA